jgi:pimeloyl-ACP methyl ester carboxylesterase
MTPGRPSITTTAIRSLHTADGTVGYRRFGSGPPLILLMGFSGTIDSWSPGFVDALATHYQVITPDNAGVGRTSPLQADTVPAMADQTSAFMTALHLQTADVLGWSMGGMIAQALAVRHPGQVHRLVLCATLPGDGHATLPSQAALAKLADTGDPAAVLSLLYPADQTAAARTLVSGILSYAQPDEAPKATISAQSAALAEWTSGADQAAAGVSAIRVPTLVADGAEDPLVPLSNSRHLVAVIPGAQLVIYPDSAHAFLFQNQAGFVTRLDAFLR